MLSLDGITHAFRGVPALNNASLAIRAGSVHALLGENGAGKTTLMRIAFGLLQPDRGTITVAGTPTILRSPADALAQGIGMVHQHFTLVPSMTVAQNVALGRRGLFDPVQTAAQVRDIATRAGLVLDPMAVVRDLPIGAQQRCEIVKALARDVQLLILDEPTAVLAPEESAELLRWIRAYADAGHAVVLITHKLRDALAIADDITVLHRGRTVLTTSAATTSAAAIAQAMIGGVTSRDAVGLDAQQTEGTPAHDVATAPAASTTVTDRPIVLALRHVSVRDDRGIVRVRDATVHVRAGEILGVAGVEGAGQYELLRVLAGRISAMTGECKRPATVGFVPEDRHRDALLMDAPLFENVALSGAGARRGVMPWSSLVEQTTSILQRYDVRANGAEAPARALSGGNQQKFVIGRELESARDALVVENPSRGLDFVATAAVHQALRAARDAGMAVVIYSSDLDEVITLADRVIAMHDGVPYEVDSDRDVVGHVMLTGHAE